MSPTTPYCPCEGQGRKTNTSTTGTTVDTDQWKYNPTTTCGGVRSVVKQTFELGEYYSWDDYELDQVIDDTTGKILFAIIVREDDSACQKTEESNLKR